MVNRIPKSDHMVYPIRDFCNSFSKEFCIRTELNSSGAGTLNSTMRPLKVSQCFDIVDGVLQYQYTKVLYMDGKDTYMARTHTRLPSNLDISLRREDLTEITFIPVESHCPRHVAEFTLAPEPLPEDCYIKRPDLISYREGSNISEAVLNDIRACETLRRYPHPNIAKYYGCQVHSGRVTGLCFAKYPETLMERVNPGHLNKDELSQKAPQSTRNKLNHYLMGIKQGIDHMHSLGLVHNDITPTNFMITPDDIPVIIDFDSCLPEGLQLGLTKRTFQWHDPSAQFSCASNDDWAFKEICTWLVDDREISAYQE